jgi:hypothetical protein
MVSGCVHLKRTFAFLDDVCLENGEEAAVFRQNKVRWRKPAKKEVAY